jgi:hypothetical protein
MLQGESLPVRIPNGVFPGAVILTCGLLSIVVVTHHPTVHAHSPAQLFAGINAVGPADEIVHAVLIAFMLALTFGFSVFAMRQGMTRLTSLAGILSYGLGALALCGAGLIDGFFTPMIVSANSSATGAALSGVLAVLSGGAAMIQVLTRFGFIAMSAGICAWSAGLATSPGVQRYVAITGLVAAIAPVGILAAAHRIGPHVLTSIVICQAVWYVTVGTLMVRRVL